MKNNTQKYTISCMLTTPDILAICRPIIKSSYFDPELRHVVEFILEYYDAYSKTPSAKLLEHNFKFTGLVSEPVASDEMQYIISETESFCRQRAVEQVLYKSVDHLKNNEYSKLESELKEALAVAVNTDLGTEYFQDPTERFKRVAEELVRFSTGYSALDDALTGGIARTEVLLFTANSGGGKSIAMTNLGLNLAKVTDTKTDKKLNVLYVSLELSEDLIAQRMDTMVSGVSSVVWKGNTDLIKRSIEKTSSVSGDFRIKRMPVNTTTNHIRSYIKEHILRFGHPPDVLIVDYLDLMSPNNRSGLHEQVFEKDKACAEELRELGHEFQLIIVTASQQNRTAVGAEVPNHSHIAGGISKINTVDWAISIQMTAAMKAAGEINLVMLKTRSSGAEGMVIPMLWDNKWLRIRPREEDIYVPEPIVKSAKLTIPNDGFQL